MVVDACGDAFGFDSYDFKWRLPEGIGGIRECWLGGAFWPIEEGRREAVPYMAVVTIATEAPRGAQICWHSQSK